jgi:hypothetical protein
MISTWMSEQVLHPQVFRAASAPSWAPITAVCFGAAQHIPECKALAIASGIRIVVQGESAPRSASLKNRWYCCTLRRVSEAAEFDQQRLAEQLGNRKVIDLRKTVRSSSSCLWASPGRYR